MKEETDKSSQPIIEDVSELKSSIEASELGMDVDLGLLTAQGAISIPLGEKLGFSLAGRYSNVNLIYDGLVNRVKKKNISYRFYDINMGLLYKPTDNDAISVNYYQGCDYAGLDFLSLEVLSRLAWGNRVASVNWNRKNDALTQDHILYYSSYHSTLDVTQMNSRGYLPASIQTVGAKSEMRYMANVYFLTCGAEVMYHSIAPQAPQMTGDLGNFSASQVLQRSAEGALFVQGDYMLGGGLEIIGGLRASSFYHGRWRVGIDPRLTLRYQPSSMTTWQLTAGTYTQYLHQVGFSSNGLPSEFWISSDQDFAPQHAGKLSLALQQDMLDRRYRISVETYFTRLTGQVEYKGNALGLITREYNLVDNLVVGDGYNYGVDLMLQKNYGQLTGWIGYSWAKAPRSFMRNGEWVTYPSVHNRVHDLSAVANWHISDRWNVSATYLLATGTPYTEIKSGYILGENGLVQLGEYNGARYPMLTRLDLGVSYQLKPIRHIAHSVKFAVYNATFSKNPISYNYNNYNGNIIYKRPVYIFSTAIPSVSYFMHF